jgi:hypothetical protein
MVQVMPEEKKHRMKGGGRKRLSTTEQSETVHVRVTSGQALKFKTLGPSWLRAKLDEAEIKDENA